MFVLPSRLESFPLAIVEAMLSGLPVVATDVGSVAEAVIDDVTGVLVPPARTLRLSRRRFAGSTIRTNEVGSGRLGAFERFDSLRPRRWRRHSMPPHREALGGP